MCNVAVLLLPLRLRGRGAVELELVVMVARELVLVGLWAGINGPPLLMLKLLMDCSMVLSWLSLLMAALRRNWTVGSGG